MGDLVRQNLNLESDKDLHFLADALVKTEGDVDQMVAILNRSASSPSLAKKVLLGSRQAKILMQYGILQKDGRLMVPFREDGAVCFREAEWESMMNRVVVYYDLFEVD